jgi:hypothetical protein
MTPLRAITPVADASFTVSPTKKVRVEPEKSKLFAKVQATFEPLARLILKTVGWK